MESFPPSFLVFLFLSSQPGMNPLANAKRALRLLSGPAVLIRIPTRPSLAHASTPSVVKTWPIFDYEYPFTPLFIPAPPSPQPLPTDASLLTPTAMSRPLGHTWQHPPTPTLAIPHRRQQRSRTRITPARRARHRVRRCTIRTHSRRHLQHARQHLARRASSMAVPIPVPIPATMAS
jgi:hypothetical protein